MATFLLEVGTEELPADFVTDALEQWRSRITASLASHYLTPEAIDLYGTPRRLAVMLRGLPDRQPDQAEDIKGPPAQAAFQNGMPTKAAEGFAQKQGIDVSALEIRPTDKGDFVFVRKTTIGQPAANILVTLVPQWITGLEGRRFMRWADGELRFPRPIRWLVALLDDVVLPLEIPNGLQGCRSDRTTQGHRILHPEPVVLAQADTYVNSLASAGVIVDLAQRRTLIQQQANAAATSVDGVVVINPSLLDEVVNLVESPSAVVGKFDPAFLELPAEVIVMEMESHQRYFPVVKQAGSSELLPYFITISNGDPAKSETISAGNERVLRARLADGKFFFDADRTQALEAYLPRLETVTFQESLGSVRNKVDRISAIASRIADQCQVSSGDRSYIQRTALLCKADLVTQMVGEFPELQGVMGENYARAAGEPEAIALGIAEHYLPKGAGDRLPQTLSGQVVGMADRLDTLVCIFGLGMVPSGSSDPFALRRSANAIINVIWQANLPISLAVLLEQAIADFAQTYSAVIKTQPQDLYQQLQDFFLQRIRTLLQDDHAIDYDLVNAVLGENDPDYAQRALTQVLDVRDRARFLQTIRQDGRLAAIYETVNRASRLASQGTLAIHQLDVAAVVQPKLFQKSSEQTFFDGLQQLSQQQNKPGDYDGLVAALTQLTPTVGKFFDGADSVLVMDPDPAVKANRLNLLGVLRNYTRVLADFGAIVKS